jgi:8-oxo-dGTP diphosphatase
MDTQKRDLTPSTCRHPARAGDAFTAGIDTMESMAAWDAQGRCAGGLGEQTASGPGAWRGLATDGPDTLGGEEPQMEMTGPSCIRTAARALIEREDEILLIRYVEGRGEWFTLPGGGQLPGEDLPTALARECEEELGGSVRVGALLWVRELISPNHPGHHLPSEIHQVEFVFRCELGAGPGAIRPRRSDPGQDGFCWLDRKALVGVRFFPGKLGAILGSPPEDGHVVYLGDTQ